MAEGIEVGLTGTATTAVKEINTAKVMKSGALPVFATPAMCALMEEAAQDTIQSYLAKGEGSVGIKLAVTHDAPSAIGSVIIAKATVVAVEGRRIDFEVEAFDGDLCIGKGTHSRFVINNEKFMSKLEKR